MPQRVERTEWVVIGGGFAGLATAHALSAAGLGPGVVLEREPQCGVHASGRNAAMFRLAEADPVIRAFARRSRRLLDQITSSGADLVQTTGGLTLAAAAEVPTLVERAASLRRERTKAYLLPMRQARVRFPELRGFRAEAVLWCPDEGVFDLHALLTRYIELARGAGFQIQTGCTVSELVYEAGQITGVRVADRVIRAGGVIDASGAWAGRLRSPRASPLKLQPLKRHLFVTGPVSGWRRQAPFVWMIGDEFYVRPEGAGLLASPCDEQPSPPEVPVVDPAVSAILAEKLTRAAPTLADMTVRRAWACLRTFAADRRPIIGADPELAGLFHVSGLGGFGVTASAAIGELLSSLVQGAAPSWIDATLVDPDRAL